MYTIMLDGTTFFDPRLDQYSIEAPILEREANRIGTLTFTIYPGHPRYNDLELFSSLLRVYRDDTLYIVMRPIKRTRKMMDGIEYECEEMMGALHDTVYRPDAYGTANLMYERVGYILANHVAEHAGTPYHFVSYPLYCTRAFDAQLAEEDEPFAVNEYKPHWDVMMDNTVDEYEGYIFAQYLDDRMIFHYQTEDELPQGTQHITFGENMKDVFIESGGDDFFTRVIPLGVDVKTSQAYQDLGGKKNVPKNIIGQRVQTGEHSYSESVDYIPDWQYEDATGVVIEHVERWENVKKKSVLYQKGLAYLNEHKLRFAQNVRLTAIDLHDLDLTIDAFDFMTRVYAYSEVHNIGAYYVVRKLELHLASPEESEIEIGTEEPSLTDLTTAAANRSAARTSDLSSRVFGLENP